MPPARCPGLLIPIPFGEAGVNDICINIFPPFSGVAAGGLYSTLAYFFNIIFLILFILWIIMSGLAVLDAIRSSGDTELLESGKERVMNIWRGLGIGLMVFVLISALGLILGIGLPSDWTKNLAQCGTDRTVYYSFIEDFQHEATVVGGALLAPGNNVPIYCCPDDPNGVGWSGLFPMAGITCEEFSTYTIK